MVTLLTVGLYGPYAPNGHNTDGRPLVVNQLMVGYSWQATDGRPIGVTQLKIVASICYILRAEYLSEVGLIKGCVINCHSI